MPSSTLAESTAPPPARSTKQQAARATWPSYEELLAQQEPSRLAFGRMLLNWRRRNGWTQYTVCNWAKAIGEPSSVISYGNLSVIEQGKAGELRQRSFWQLGELNRRIAAREWGRFGDAALRKKLEAAMPLGAHCCRGQYDETSYTDGGCSDNHRFTGCPYRDSHPDDVGPSTMI
jgi:hypothetical protein